VLAVVIDTATPAVTAAVVLIDPAAGVTLLAERRELVDTAAGRAHGELLAPALAAILEQAGVEARNLAALVAGVGPGPFTGLRVGLAVAATMGHALSIPTYGVCSLDGLGALTTETTTLVATDARRKEIYWAVYRGGLAVTEPAVDRPARVAELLTGGEVQAAVGDGAHRYADVLPFPVLDEPRYPSALALAERAADRIRAAAPGELLTPLYLRRPDAAEPHAPKAVVP